MLTGVNFDGEIKNAVKNPLTWRYFDKPRVVFVEKTSDGTVALIRFSLNDWYEGYKLKDELTLKFIQEGNFQFMFDCISSEESVSIGNKNFAVVDKKCTASDGRQTLEINSRNLKYVESIFDSNPTLKSLVDYSNVNLMDKLLIKKITDEKSDFNNKSAAEEKSRAAKDI